MMLKLMLRVVLNLEKEMARCLNVNYGRII